MSGRASRYWGWAICLAFLLLPQQADCWGFYGHRSIARQAVLCVQGPLFGWLKPHAEWMANAALAPDKRRGIVKGEAARHYLDLDYYGEAPFASLPRSYAVAVCECGEDSLLRHGILPWAILGTHTRLVKAFAEGREEDALKLCADLCHYVSDATVPLHTCSDYDGKAKGFKGLHKLWEADLPEHYLPMPLPPAPLALHPDSLRPFVWALILETHAQADSMFAHRAAVGLACAERYGLAQRGRGALTTGPSTCLVDSFWALEGRRVAQQHARAVRATVLLWQLAYIEAGQPHLKGVGKQAAILVQGYREGHDGCTH